MTDQRKTPHGLPFAPVKVGVLIDLDMGTKDDFLATLRFTFDEAYEQRVILRPVELLVKEAVGLPRLEAKNSIDGYLDLVDQGVLCTIGPLITDNSLALAPVINRAGVPAITWTGTDRYFGEYCFNLGNGGLAEETAIMATWIRRSGFKTVGMIHEISPGGVEYASNFRYYAAKERLDVLIEAYTTQIPEDLEDTLRRIRDQQPDCLAYLGYGYPTILMGPMFKNLGWNPPRIMTTAFQFCYAKPEWMAALEGWHGIDQMCEDNPLLLPLFDRVAAKLGKRRDHTVTALSYDTARLIAEGLARANLLTPQGLKDGLEKVRMLPAANGGPRTHMSLGPFDHKAYKGDWLLIRRIEGGKTVFVGLHEPVAL
ncbi:MAG TPA: ABC transporter substrate-binding protein [Candidatus Kryptonia bacterium]|nr:ABC transporter substrate-binding protein [Candidatus Kryptonia bacterium]